MAAKPSQAKSNIVNNELDSAVLTHYVVTKNDVYKEKAYDITENSYGNFQEPEVLYQAIQKELFDVNDIPFPGPKPGAEKFTFIDLFAGIGGFRLALQNLGGLCLYSSEYDKYAQKTYLANFGETPFGDITKEETKSYIPKTFDVLCGGFPCQPFSIAGVSKKNSLGRKHGFEDEKQGNLFFHVAEIIEKHRPKAFFLENVKNLVSHDKGNTFKVIRQTLLDLGYSFDHRVLNGKHFVPQHRDRTIMVGFDKKVFGEDISFDFNLVKLPEANKKIKSILKEDVDPKYTLSDHLWNYLQEYAKKHKLKGNGFGFGLVNLDGISRTMSARYYKDGAEILIPQNGSAPRRLTPDECAALQGYPVNKGKKSFRIPVSDNQAYKQFGNSVVTPLIQAVGKEIVNLLQHE
ncbi:DNA (cytosine-5-)-methyltransferase [Mucilaginibacter xinganensis]|uniref:Cytosine-specific methyltransferase n=1 Tax=Mucilaginibacter xinganensis TaxID=1234841 RepID=A0A223P334_9SPHI|nr:DNA (cytosine-5-)-methyltransferase [Mucilaginibacter xinganensis]ASU36533.1 DNA (cytosine-5-)-methyltransferase [Mucilaginibacter xinganensis]